MNIFGAIGGFFARLFGFLSKHISSANVAMAVQLVEQAARNFVDNASRREWAVGILIARGFPESIARLLVELAVQEVKRRTTAQTPA